MTRHHVTRETCPRCGQAIDVCDDGMQMIYHNPEWQNCCLLAKPPKLVQADLPLFATSSRPRIIVEDPRRMRPE